jgi:hypothetical protein
VVRAGWVAGRRPTRGDVISTLGWILSGIAAWLAVAAVLGVVIGRTIRLRDRQQPEPPPGRTVDDPVPWIPRQDTGDQRPGS